MVSAKRSRIALAQVFYKFKEGRYELAKEHACRVAYVTIERAIGEWCSDLWLICCVHFCTKERHECISSPPATE